MDLQDEAARRRFVKRFYVPLPDKQARRVLFDRLLSKNDHLLSIENIYRLVDRTEGYSGADVTNLCKEAAMGPMRDVGSELFEDVNREVVIPPITLSHFDFALKVTRPTVSPSDLAAYEEWDRQFGTGRPLPRDTGQAEPRENSSRM